MSEPVYKNLDRSEYYSLTIAKKILEDYQAPAIEFMQEVIKTKGLRDGGSCVIGEGLYIEYLPSKRHKYPHRMFIVDQPFQGNNHLALYPVRDWLLEKGIKVKYAHGRLD